MNKPEILIIDDEAAIRKLLEITLKNKDYSVKMAVCGKDGLVAAAYHPPDLILLDLGLPDESGQSVLKKLREWYNNPIIILSVLNDEESIVQALDNGANDYLTKPYRTGELLARIRTVLRNAKVDENNMILNFNELQIDLNLRTIKKNNEVLKLTAIEYSLLVLFAKNEGKVLTHQFLLKQIWGLQFSNETQYLRVYIAQLRKKIENDATKPRYLITESGIGYRFVAG